MSGPIEFTYSGTKEMRQKAKKLQDDSRRSMLKSVDNFTTTEMREMKKRTPVETGELQDSGYTEKAHFVGDQVQARLGFTAEHAMVVHEDLEAFHRVGQAKYMESVINESAPYFPTRVAEDMKGDLKT